MIEIPRSMFDQIVDHAVAGLPNEACGVLAGENGRPVHVYRMKNSERSPKVYRFESREQLAVFREVDDRGWHLLAFFHSHPSTDAYPSKTDREYAHERDPSTGELVSAHPGTMYLILSLRNRESPELRGFRFVAGEPVEEEVRIA